MKVMIKIFCAVLMSGFILTAYALEADINNADGNALVAVDNEDKIDLNTADAETIAESFKGIGEKRSQAIVTYREDYGPLISIDELAEVDGISPKYVNDNIERLSEVFTVR